ncbi:MAG: hypothetical protein A3K22_06050 [Deltaproteobacteria bacterium RBG_16_42_7]|nr:MAG: hypothetical protein A3K22_06050 [Deltaproteobacteria bacterium RBG_16_42_7]
MQYVDLGKNIMLGVIAGIAWGWVVMAVNVATGAFEFENTLLHNLVVFAVGGAVFGIVVSGFLSLLQRWLPFKNIVANAVLLSTMLWLLLRIGGMLLSSIEPERYHLITAQSIQGVILAIVMGCILGILWKINKKRV